MKLNLARLLWWASCCSWCLVFAADPLTESLQKGLLEEEVNRDLNAAVKAYEGAVKQADAQRQAAATAVFRLAESYRKLGRTNDAVAQYRRLLDQFGDQAPLAALSRTNLSLLAPAAADSSRGPLPPAVQRQRELLQQELALVEEQLKSKQLMTEAGRASRDDLLVLQREALALKRQMAALESQTRVDLLDLKVPPGPATTAAATPTVDPADEASVREEIKMVELELLSAQKKFENGKAEAAEVRRAQKELIELKRKLPENAAKDRQVALLQEALKLAEENLQEIRKRIEVGAAPPLDENPCRREILALQRELGAVQRGGATPPRRGVISLRAPSGSSEVAVDPDEPPINLSQFVAKYAGNEADGDLSRVRVYGINRTTGANEVREFDVAKLLAGGGGEDVVLKHADLVVVPDRWIPAGQPGAAPATNEETDEIKRIQAIIKNSPDLVNARNATKAGGTPLHKAAENGYLAVAEFLLAHGADVNATDRSRQSPLHVAAAGGHKRMGELFLAQGADVKASDYQGQTPLYLAVENGYLAVAEVLLAAGAEVNTRSSPGGAATPQPHWESSPLHAAADKGFPALIELLLQHGAAITAQDHGGRTPLVRAIAQPTAFRLLLEKGADPNALDASGVSPLFHAVIAKQPPLVRLLLDHQAEVDARIAAPEPEGEWTVLFRAVWDGQVELTRLLLEAGANINAQAASGITPVHCAVIKDVPATHKLLLERKAEVNVRDTGGNTPLHYALEAGSVDFVEALLGAGADPNASGWTKGPVQPWPPLFKAIIADDSVRLPLVSSLLKHGADVNARTTNGWTALHRAAQYNLDPVAELLVASQADVNLRGSRPEYEPKLGERKPLTLAKAASPVEGAGTPRGPGAIPMRAIRPAQPPGVALPQPGFASAISFGTGTETWPADRDVTPLHVAVANQNLPLAKFLLDHGAKVNVGDAKGRTPLHFAVNRRDLDLVRLLLDAQADPNARDASGETPWTTIANMPEQAQTFGTPLPGRGIVSTARPSEIVALLRQRGARTVMSDPNAITVTRKATGYSAKVLTRASRDWNQFTVLELLAVHYGLLAQSSVVQPAGRVPRPAFGGKPTADPLAFPDLAQIRLARPQPNGGEKVIPVDLSAALQTGDCSAEVMLQWGDVVEIPEEDHPLDAAWDLSDALRTAFKKCLERRVEIVVKGEHKAYELKLPYERSSDGQSWVGDGAFSRYSWDVATTLARSGLLRTSSDRSAIMVERVDPVTGTRQEWRVDCAPGSQEADLWLRDGDVIEVPDRLDSPETPGTGVVRVLGEVKRPGTVPVGTGPRKDLIDAVAESGGLTENARAEIEFTRDGQTQTLRWDQLKVEADPEKKIWLQPGDIIEVKRRLL